MSQFGDSCKSTLSGDAAASGRAEPGQIRQLGEAHEFLERMVQFERMQVVGTLAGGIAHDFNNLLTAINGYSELALSRLKPGDNLRPTIEEIQKAGERAAVLTRQLLAFSRKRVPQPQVLDLNAVVEGIRDVLLRLLGRDIRLITRFAPDLARMAADPGRIEQVVLNLAVNARDAMPHGGTLIIESANVEIDGEAARELGGMEAGSYVMLSVSDTGTGMPPEVLTQVFEPFFTTKEVGVGTGLGLYAARGIVEQIGGYVCCSSGVGQGSVFRIHFPASSESPARSRRT